MRTISDILKALGAIVIMVAIVVGVPLALWSMAGFPIDELRSIAGGGLVSDVDMVGTLLRAGLLVVAWLAWFQMAWALLSELVAALRGTIASRVWALPGIQSMARRLVATAMLVTSLNASVAGALPTAPLGSPHAVDQGAADDFTSPTWTSLVDDGAGGPLTLDSLRAVSVPDESPWSQPGLGTAQEGGIEHRVSAGETFWSVAEDYTGDGMRWKELRNANVGSVMVDGTVLGEMTEYLRPGWVIRIPEAMTPSMVSAAPQTVTLTGPLPELGRLTSAEPDSPLRPPPPVPASDRSSVGSSHGGGAPETVVVADRDHFWSLARDRLSDAWGRTPTDDEIAPYWASMVDANQSRLAPPGDPDLIHPGQTMIVPGLPPDPSLAPQTAAPEAVVPEASVAPESSMVPEPVVPESSTVPGYAAPQAGVPEVAVPEVAVPEALVPEVVVPEADQSRPGPLDAPPPMPPRSHQTPPEPEGRLQSETTSNRYRTELPAPRELQSESVADEPAAATVPASDAGVPSAGVYDIATRQRVDLILGTGGFLLASGALLSLRRRRAFSMVERDRHHRPADPDSALDPMERLLRQRADEDRARWVAAALASLSARTVWENEATPLPVLAQLVDDGLRVAFEAPDPVAAPLPWRTDDGGATWMLPASVPTAALGAFDGFCPTPAFVSLSRSLLVNLEAIGTLGVHGTRSDVDDLVNSLVHELALSPASERVDIRTTFDLPGTAGLDLVRRQDPADISREIERWADQFQGRLTESGATGAYALRLMNPDESINPMVVVTDPAAMTMLTSVIGIAGQQQLPLAVIVADSSSRSSAEWPTASQVMMSRSVDGSQLRARLEPAGIEFEPMRLSRSAANDLGVLLNSASRPNLARVEARLPLRDRPRLPPSRNLVGTGVARSVAPESFPGPDRPPEASVGESTGSAVIESEIEAGPPITERADAGGLRVILLGDVGVDGLQGDPLTSQQLSLLCFLAASRSASRDAIIEALWGGRAVSRSRFPNLLAELRSRLGRHHLPESRAGRYQLDGVTCDLDDFEALIRQAGGESDPAAKIRYLEEALSLVRGVPFTAPARRFWFWVGDHSHQSARVEALIADAAYELGNLQIDIGNPEGAQAACERGLLASPLDERLVATLTRIYVDLGRTSAAVRLVDSWEGSVNRLDCGEPSEVPRRIITG